MTTEAQVLSHMMDRTRDWTRYYLNGLKGQDPHRRFVCEGKGLNTMFWLVAHITLTENGLLLATTGGDFEKFWWAKHFTLNAAGLPPEECPPFAEIMEAFTAVHAKVMVHLPTLSLEQMNAPNPTKLNIGTTIRDVITHAIRHEGGHSGQLAWLCKLYGIKMI